MELSKHYSLQPPKQVDKHMIKIVQTIEVSIDKYK